MLSRDDIRRALPALAGELDQTSVRCEIVVVGGAAVVLLYGAGQAAPLWAGKVEVAPTAVCLVKAARTMPRLRRLSEQAGPEQLRRRKILAPPEFLTVA